MEQVSNDPDGEELWGWDLGTRRAVRWALRGPGHQILGPYRTKQAAEAWAERRDERDQQWEDDDERWAATWSDDEPDQTSPQETGPDDNDTTIAEDRSTPT